MRVLLIVDALFARHERAMIERTIVGLLDEGAEVRLLVPNSVTPEGVSAATSWDAPVHVSTYIDWGIPVLLPARVRSLVHALDEADSLEWDVVHAYGGKTWSFASELAQQLHAALVLEFWRMGLASRAQSVTKSGEGRVMCALSDRALREALDEEGVRLPSRLCAWGVLSPVSPRSVDVRGDVSVLFHSSGRDVASCVSAFDGVIEALEGRGGAHIFVNAEASERASLWVRAKGLEALGKITVIDKIEQQRDLALKCDVYVNPDSAIEQRSLILEALADGVVVVASERQRCSALIDGETARLVGAPSQSAWAGALAELLGDNESAAALGRGAWAHMKEHRKVSTYIGALTDLYSELMAAREGV